MSVIFRDLDRAECEALLARNHVGRIAFSFKDRVDIQPIGYVYEGDWLSGRTEEGAKLETVQHSPWVAFEVDEVEGPYDWRSVVIRGTVYLMHEGSPDHAETAAAIRKVIPDAFSPSDPAPHRTVLFRIYARDMTGRLASSRGEPTASNAAPGS